MRGVAAGRVFGKFATGMRVTDRKRPGSTRDGARRADVVHLVPRRGAPEPRALPIFESDVDVVRAIRAGERAGGAALYDRHHEYVRRVLTRVLGPDADLGDLVQDVFVAAIDSIERLSDPGSLRSWLAGISVNCVRMELRRRTKSRWLRLMPSSEWPELEAPVSTPEIDEAVRATYRVLGHLGVDERIPFALRFIEGMDLLEVAGACQVSLATIKRRLASARKKFVTMASTYPELGDWLRGGAS
ncbi:MAG: sigma-70 family RNA polymerase sigma factor [Polyangiaceae bacterium]